MLNITLPPEIEVRLETEAAKQGVAVSEYASRLITDGLSKPQPDYATIALLDRWEKEDATDDPEEIARRQVEFEEFKQGMNRNRLEMEGPDYPPVYP